MVTRPLAIMKKIRIALLNKSSQKSGSASHLESRAPSRYELITSDPVTFDPADADIAVIDAESPQADRDIQIARTLHERMPVIFLVNPADPDLHLHGGKSGPFEYMTKPLQMDDLHIRAVAALRRWQFTRSALDRFDWLQSLADSVIEGVMIIEGGATTYVNLGACRIFGRTMEEMMHADILELASPEERERIAPYIDQFTKQGAPAQTLEYWIVRKDGTRRYVHNFFSPVMISGSYRGHVIITLDQTDRRLAWESLIESEERFRNLAESTPMAILLFQDDKWIFANNATERITGYNAEDLLRMNFWDIVHPDHKALVQERGRKRQAATEVVSSYEFKIVSKSGKETWVLLNGTSTIYNGKPAGLINVIDITEIKNIQEELAAKNLELTAANEELRSTMEELEATNEEFETINGELITSQRELESSERRFRDMVENVPVGIYQTSAEGRFVNVNPEMVKILGYDSIEDLLNVDNIAVNVYVDPDMRGSFTRTIERDMEVKDFETKFRKKNGEIIWVSINARLRKDAEGRSLYYDGYIRDITRHKQNSEEKERLEKQLLQAQKMEAIGRLAGGIAHDFNNLLTAIIGNAEMSLMLNEKGSVTESIKDILSTAIRAADLTRQLLAFSRKQVIKPLPVNLNDILDKMERLLSRIIGEDVDIAIKKGDNLAMIEADPSQIEQLIVNLVVNSRDAMPRGGRLEIMTCNSTVEEGLYDGSHIPPPGKYVMLRITDTGSGIQKEIIDHIFEPFFTTKGEMGTGLGLSTVFGVVKQNKGHVTVESEENKGTAFIVYLPQNESAPVDEGRRDAESNQPQKSPEGKTILIVEDEESVLKIAKRALAQRGYNILAATNGSDALELCRSHGDAIHLLLTDVILPGINGPELAKSICELRPGIKVLYMSGYTDQVIGNENCIGDNMNFLPKPFLPSELVQRIDEILLDS